LFGRTKALGFKGFGVELFNLRIFDSKALGNIWVQYVVVIKNVGLG
jgi:hypothetical protein